MVEVFGMASEEPYLEMGLQCRAQICDVWKLVLVLREQAWSLTEV